jgi:ABC-2 type transport system permease protein
MTDIRTAVWAESLKVRKSKMFWLSILASLFMAAMMGFLVFIAKNPDIASKMSLLGTKSSVIQSADWPSYLGLLAEMISALGLIGFGFVTGWIFGREYSDRTVKDLLALPFPRSYIVISKLLVASAWSILLAGILLIASLVIGSLVGLSGGTSGIMLHGAIIYGITALMALFVTTPVAFFASYGRGYLPPMGFVIITLLIGQFIAPVGLGPYFPWAVPGLYSVATMAGGPQQGAISYILLAMTGIIGISMALAWWRYADQH